MKANDVIGNKYEVISIITDSDIGIVGVCVNKYLNNKWIIKYVPNSSLKISNEVDNMLKLNHKNIPQIIDVIKTSEGCFYVMSLIDGHTISEYSKIYKYVIADVVKWMIETAEVLKHIHCYGIIHGDIKNSNIMVDDYKSLYVIDFGSSFTDKDKKSFTKRFVAPERLVDHFLVDDRSDLFSFGVVFKDMLKDYEKKNSVKKHFQRKKLRKLKKIVDKCLEINPINRYQSASDLHETLIDL